jgi:hypothetical protein
MEAVPEIPSHHEGTIFRVVVPAIHGIVVHIEAVSHVHIRI